MRKLRIVIESDLHTTWISNLNRFDIGTNRIRLYALLLLFYGEEHNHTCNNCDGGDGSKHRTDDNGSLAGVLNTCIVFILKAFRTRAALVGCCAGGAIVQRALEACTSSVLESFHNITHAVLTEMAVSRSVVDTYGDTCAVIIITWQTFIIITAQNNIVATFTFFNYFVSTTKQALIIDTRICSTCLVA